MTLTTSTTTTHETFSCAYPNLQKIYGTMRSCEFLPQEVRLPNSNLSLSATGALVMSLTYGLDIKSHDDRFLAAAERALATLEEAAVPGAFLIDTFPISTRQRDGLVFLTEHDSQ